MTDEIDTQIDAEAEALARAGTGAAVRPVEGRQESRRHHERGATLPGFAYTTEVNKGSVNMRWLTYPSTTWPSRGSGSRRVFEQDKTW